MSIFYRSLRIGKNGKKFWMYKLKTLKDDFDKTNTFAKEESYTKWGHTLRKYKLDELPALWNVLRGEMSLVGPRPEESRSIDLLPEELKKILLSVKPGLTSMASVHFVDEEAILKKGEDVFRDYWLRIKPTKIMLDVFYTQHKNWLLDLGILLDTFKRIIKLFWNAKIKSRK